MAVALAFKVDAKGERALRSQIGSERFVQVRHCSAPTFEKVDAGASPSKILGFAESLS